MKSPLTKILLSLFSAFFVLQAKADYILIGNGGEGYQVASQLFTRDLIDYDGHLNPWFGSSVDAYLKKAVAEWNPLSLTDAECELLARKLTDLNSVKPRLGDDLLLTLRYFNWSFTDQKLLLIQPDEVRSPIVEANRVAIANRMIQSILVNKNNFQLLDSKNKIALILHEAVYSLIKVTRDAKGSSQSLSITRQLTAGFFNSITLSSLGFLDLMNSYLNRVQTSGSEARDLVGSFMQVTVTDSTRDPWLYKEIKISPTTPTQLLEDVTALCTKFFETYDYASVAIFYRVPPRQVVAVPYKNRDGVDQYALQVAEIYNYPVSYDVSLRNVQTCSKQVFVLLQKEMTQ